MFRFIFLAVVGLLPFITASPTSVEFMNDMSIGGTNSNTGDRLVFCHFMVRHFPSFPFPITTNDI